MSVAKYLEWDSAFFGFPVASFSSHSNVEIDRELDELKKKGFQLVYLFVSEQFNQPETQLLERYGGFLADKKITFKIRLNNDLTWNHDPDVKINYYSKLNDSLVKLSILSGEYSRFKIDPNISETQFQELFTEWIRNSVSGKNAEYVLTYHTANKPEGFITLSYKNHRGKIGLISVSDQIQNKGIGTSLIHAVFVLCKQRGIKDLEVVTQSDNHIACNFYRKNGFVRHQLQYVYHFWLNTK